jgi:hypothetical protein
MKLTVPFLALALLVQTASAENWPNWRGPNQDGSSSETGLPAKFSTQEGVKWTTDLPGIAASVPVI